MQREITIYWRAAAVSLILAIVTIPTVKADIVGKANVVSGDILEIDGQHIKLFGIDAAEPGQLCLTKHDQAYDCGRNAAMALMSITKDVRIICRDEAPDAQGRLVASCFVGRFDLSRQMVLSGFALAELPAGEKYGEDEEAARRLPEGMWKGRFNKPWNWRAGERLEDLP